MQAHFAEAKHSKVVCQGTAPILAGFNVGCQIGSQQRNVQDEILFQH